MLKTPEDVTQELNQLLKENNMVLDVHTVLRTDGIRHVVKVVYIVKPEIMAVEPAPEAQDE